MSDHYYNNLKDNKDQMIQSLEEQLKLTKQRVDELEIEADEVCPLHHCVQNKILFKNTHGARCLKI